MTVAAKQLPKAMEQARPLDASAATVLVSTDPALRAVLRTAVGESVEYRQADSADEAVDLLMRAPCGVLIVDLTVVRGEVGGLLASLREQFPELVVIAAGARDDEQRVAGLLSDGTLFRFLHKPASPGRAKLFVDAALERHRGATAGGPLHRIIRRRPAGRWMLVPLAAILIAGAVAWWLTRVPEPAPELTPATSETTPEQEAVASLLERARTAMREQRLVPPGENALDLYLEALAANPDEPAALDGLRRVIDTLLAQAESALAAEDLDATRETLAQVRRARPEHPRLAFLEAQVARAEAAELARIASPTAEESPETVEMRRLLAIADRRIAQGRLLEADGDDARGYLLRAHSIDRTDPEVRSVAAVIGAALVERGETALEAGDLDAAQRWSRGAAEFAQASGTELRGVAGLADRVTAALAERSEARVANHLDLAAERLDQENWIAPAGDSARDHLIAARALGADPAALAALDRRLLEGLIGAARASMQRVDLQSAQALLDAAERLAPSDDTVAELSATFAAARARQAFFDAVVPASSLSVVRSDAPSYPRDAIRRGVEGFVELHFTVARDGSTREFQVVGSEPEGVFEEAAIDALAKWRFDPVTRDGEAVEQRASVRLKFQLDR